MIGSKINHKQPTTNNPQSRRGFTLLFASLIGALMLTIGLSVFSLIYKELVLSSTISESQEAFAAADSAAECALFWDSEHPGYENSVFGGQDQNLVPNGLIGYWSLDETSGTTAKDAAGTNDGTLVNMDPATDWIQGKINNALDFDGDNDYLRVGSFTWNGSGPITVSFWSYAISPAENTTLFQIGSTVSDDRILSHAPWSNGFLYWDYGDISTTGRISTNYSAYMDKWTLVTLVSEGKNGSRKAIYLNGSEVATSGTSDGTDMSHVTLYVALGGGHRGRVDEFRIYNRVLTEAEIDILYNQTEPAGIGPVPQNSDLLCNNADITNPSTGWDNANGWDVTNVTETTANTVFDILFSDNTCATVTVDKNGATTTIESRGYNTCNLGNPRRVERGLRVTY